jgi:hypothetical protein
MKKIIILTFLIIALVLTGFKIIGLAQDPLEVLDMRSTSNTIYISWEETAERYELVHENKVVWEGKQTHTTLSNLEEKTNYNYFLIAYENDKVIDKVEIRTGTTPIKSERPIEKVKKLRQIISMSEVHAVISDRSIKLFWQDLPNDKNNYELYRDGEKLSDLKNISTFTDHNVTYNETYNYEVRAVKGFEELDRQKLTEQLKKAKRSVKEDMFYDQLYLVKIVETWDKPLFGAAKANASTYQPGYAFHYVTFIPSPVAEPPAKVKVVAPYDYFHGDGRDFGLFKPASLCKVGNCMEDRYRTKTIATVVFDGGKPKTDIDSDIGVTEGYDENHNLIGKKTDKAKIKHTDIDSSSDHAEFRVFHNSNNPLVESWIGAKAINVEWSPGVTYEYTAFIWKTGSFHIVGDHDLAPNHEIYVTTYPGDEYVKAYERELVDFDHLWPTPNYPRGYINVSK